MESTRSLCLCSTAEVSNSISYPWLNFEATKRKAVKLTFNMNIALKITSIEI